MGQIFEMRGTFCVVVLCIILSLGLWPFHAPQNSVDWLPNRNGVRFAEHGAAFTFRRLPVAGPPGSREAAVEIWLQPRRIWDSGTFLSIFRSPELVPFMLRQSETAVLVESAADQPEAKKETLLIPDVFQRDRPAFLTVVSSAGETSVYVDGALIVSRKDFPIYTRQLAGRLILADSPGQPDEWLGRLLGLAIYQCALAPQQVLHNYTAWREHGAPEPVEGRVALYTFDRHAGNTIQDEQSHVDLYIPGTYQAVYRILLKPFWDEFEMTRSYWGAALKNIVGFVPLGFCFYAYFLKRSSKKRAVLLTIAAGALVSTTIEVLQAFLPTRDSGTTDIITNTLGAGVGVVAYQLAAPMLIRLPGGAMLARKRAP